MKKFSFYSALAGTLLLAVSVSGCGTSSSEISSIPTPEAGVPKTAPILAVEIQTGYKASAQATSVSFAAEAKPYGASVEGTDAQLTSMVTEYKSRIESHQKVGLALSGDSTETTTTTSSIPAWDKDKTYAKPGNKVRFTGGAKHGVFINSWWTKGDTPTFTGSNAWKLITRTDSDSKPLQLKDSIENWISTVAYTGGAAVKHSISNTSHCFVAKYWTKGNTPILTGGNTGKKDWESPWKVDKAKCESTATTTVDPTPITIDKIPASTTTTAIPDKTPIVPPVIPVKPSTPTTRPSTPTIVVSGDGLPASGYAFLRKVTTAHWNWMFPLRSGLYNEKGGTRNRAPFAKSDGSTDVFSLANFKKAVVEYNKWAKAKGYKQFLNEGTMKQQAQEFIVFWAKSSRETSGSWGTAKSPWIEDYVINSKTTKAWKGGLYWVEEVGYSTDKNGESKAINYVDAASTYKPVAKRSYYGRGIIQLSWNYNYGAFSAWLYDNRLMTSIITERGTLLKRPDYVATKGDLSILSGIWFWMTPQGVKPSSHDVLYGNVYNISKSTKDPGLPQRNDGKAIPAASGDTTDEAIFAYRLGTVINIVNGGLECNKAAKWHSGPPQRVSYFNAYTYYFNSEISGLNATMVTDAIDVWNIKVKPDSTENLKNTTCYSQKSYYGW